MFDYTSYRDYLNDELLKRTNKNPSYSQRAFAKALGLSPGELSEILRGIRKLTLKSAFKISKSLGLTSAETKHLVYMIEFEQGKDVSSVGENILETNTHYKEAKLSNDTFDVVSEWYHFAILNLAECEGFCWSFTWIAKQLGIKVYQVKAAIEKMVNIGLIKKIEHKNGDIDYDISNEFVMSTEGIPSKAIRNYHRQILEKAIDSLEFQSIEQRDITGIGLSISKEDLPRIKKDISDFQDSLIEKYSKGKKNRAYQLEMAFFALSGETT